METSIIDGQQRITTCSILNAALADYIEEVIWDKDDAKVVRDLYLLNPANLWDDKHYKLKLTKLDDEKYRKLISWWDKDFSQDEPSNVIKNYRFFKESIWNFVWKDSVKVWIVKNWLAKLFIVDISLNRIQDNPQLIFESMNSTWLDLSKAELIKNFLCMDIPTQQQSELYNKYRFPMDQKLENSVNLYDQFFRDYLTFKSASWRIPTFPLLYDEFKKYKLDSKLSIEELLEDIYRAFSNYAEFTQLIDDEDKYIKNALEDIYSLQANVCYPFLLTLFEDRKADLLSKEHLLKILRLVESYVFRRYICNVPTNSMNKTFAIAKRFIDKTNTESYYESVVAYFLLQDSYKYFPRDEEFINTFQFKDIYNWRNCKYILEKLENFDKKEKVNAENYSIEHIMPQNTKNNIERKKELWDNWEEIYSKYLHTIWNITLTWYNSEYSDRPFMEKKTMKWWFNESPITLSIWLRETNTWNESNIIERWKKLSELAKNIWLFEELSEDVLKKYQPEEKEDIYTYDNFKHLNSPVTKELFDYLKEKVLAIHPGIYENIKKLYISFKYQTNIVDIEPQKDKLRMTINLKYNEIIDPENRCENVAWIWRWGNGEVSFHAETKEDIDYVLRVINQAFMKQNQDNLFSYGEE